MDDREWPNANQTDTELRAALIAGRVQHIREMLLAMTPDERVQALREVHICPECGDDEVAYAEREGLDRPKRCQCRNDE